MIDLKILIAGFRWPLNIYIFMILLYSPSRMLKLFVIPSTLKRWTNVELTLNPLTAGVAYIRVFIFISTLRTIPPFKHVKDKKWHQSAIFENSWLPFCQIWIISLTWSCGSRQRDTISSVWKFRLNNSAVEGLKRWNNFVYYKPWKLKSFFNLKSLQISELALSASFEYRT